MKTLIKVFFLFIFVFNCFNTKHTLASDSPQEWAQNKLTDLWDSCKTNNIENLRTVFENIEFEYIEKVNIIGEKKILNFAKQDSTTNTSDPFLDLGREIWAYHLPKKYPQRLAFARCSLLRDKLHSEILNKKSTKNLKIFYEEWRDCIKNNYKLKTPKVTQDLVDCYSGFIKLPDK